MNGFLLLINKWINKYFGGLALLTSFFQVEKKLNKGIDIVCVCVSRSVMSDSFETLWTIACQAPLSTEFSRQEHWSELPFPSSPRFLAYLFNPFYSFHPSNHPQQQHTLHTHIHTVTRPVLGGSNLK